MPRWLFLVLLLTTTLNTPVYAETSQEKGLAIATEVDERDSGWGDMTAYMKMILRNKQGQESLRALTMSMLEVANDGDKSLVIFEDPKDIKGTALLSYTHPLTPDDQWLYLPGLKRVKRISSADKSGSFMGSEFAYEDLTSQEIEKYHYNYLRDEVVDNVDCYVIERIPAYADSGYAREIVWYNKIIYRPVKIEFYDRKNKLLKTLTFSGYNKYGDKYWRAGQMDMVNHQDNKETVLEWNQYKFQNGLTDRDFDINTLKRSR